MLIKKRTLDAWCPWCGAKHKTGGRVLHKSTERKFCSDKCVTLYQESHDRTAKIDFANNEKESGRAAFFTTEEAMQPRYVWCNSCVVRILYHPTVDPSACRRCGYGLSVYGPFDPHPSYTNAHLIGKEKAINVIAIGILKE